MTLDGWKLRTRIGAAMDPKANTTPEGAIHSPASQWPHAEHELQVLGDEQERAEHHEQAEHVRRQRGAERRRREQTHVDQRIGEPSLAAEEDHPNREADQNRYNWQQRPSILGQALDAVDDAQHGNDRLRGAQRIHVAGARVAELRQQHRTQDEQHEHDRHIDEEHRAPPEVRQNHSAEHRTDDGAGREARHPNADGERALLRIEEHVADERERRRRQASPRRAPASARATISISVLVE